MPPKEQNSVKDASVKVSSVPLVAEKNSTQYNPIKKKVDYRFVWMAVITAIAFISLVAYLVYVGNIAPMIFAGTSPKASPIKSMIFAYPLTIEKTLGESKVQVFLVSESGNPIPGKIVALTSNLGSVNPPSIETNESGTAIFTFTSDEAGVAELTPFADNQKLTQSVTVKVSED